MRTIQEIKSSLIKDYISNETIKQKYNIEDVGNFTFSSVSIENILFYVIACGIYLLEKICNDTTLELEDKASKLKPTSKSWLQNKMYNFMVDTPFNVETLEYDTTGLTDSEIQERKIISSCYIKEKNMQLNEGTEIRDVYGIELGCSVINEEGRQDQLNENQFLQLKTYFNQVKDLGVYANLLNEKSTTIAFDCVLNVEDSLFYSKTHCEDLIDYLNSYFVSNITEYSIDGIENAVRNFNGVEKCLIGSVKLDINDNEIETNKPIIRVPTFIHENNIKYISNVFSPITYSIICHKTLQEYNDYYNATESETYNNYHCIGIYVFNKQNIYLGHYYNGVWN